MKSNKDKSELENTVFEPGSARFGNFINYYSFNSVSKRLDAIPSDFFSQISIDGKKLVCLDIGCNAGDLTFGLYDHLTSSCKECWKVFLLGIDLDSTLITRCQEENKNPEHVTFENLDIMAEGATERLEQFLQIHEKDRFDLITCFSTTMWIHLNHGDTGLNSFLRRVSKLSRFLLIEPQEWKSYKSAARRMTRLNQDTFVLQELSVRDIYRYLTEFLTSESDMTLISCLGDTSWGRKVFLFKSKVSS